MKPNLLQRIRCALLGLSALLLLFAAFCYVARLHEVAAITVFPVWIWALAGLPLAALGAGRHWRGAILLAWAAYLLLLCDEPAGLLRSGRWPSPAWRAARREGRAIRVISLNCLYGNPMAADEVAPYRPDIVLLQETPPEPMVAALARRLFGSQAAWVCGPETSILARGRTDEAVVPYPYRKCFIQARLHLPSGLDVDAISLHLASAVPRYDIWRADCWAEQHHKEHARHDQMLPITTALASVPADVPVILGGDFNAPAGDAIFRLLRPRLHDTFAEAGAGWADTMPDRFPVLRIDQVWASNHFRAAAVVSRRTQWSDHRMVVCDLQW